jgi:hypothetical protein
MHNQTSNINAAMLVRIMSETGSTGGRNPRYNMLILAKAARKNTLVASKRAGAANISVNEGKQSTILPCTIFS